MSEESTSNLPCCSTSETAEIVYQIGVLAGMIWEYLDENGPTNPGRIGRALKIPAKNLNRAIGWLAREEKLDFSCVNEKETVGLKGGPDG